MGKPIPNSWRARYIINYKFSWGWSKACGRLPNLKFGLSQGWKTHEISVANLGAIFFLSMYIELLVTHFFSLIVHNVCCGYRLGEITNTNWSGHSINWFFTCACTSESSLVNFSFKIHSKCLCCVADAYCQ